MSYQAYQKAQNTAETPSQVEYRLFAKVTASLMKVKENGTKGLELVKALDWNRRMWSTFASDCAAQGNGLPDQLRASIISLSIWVSKHSSAVVRGKESIDDLININRTIMEGLAAQAQLQQKSANSNAAQPETPPNINSVL